MNFGADAGSITLLSSTNLRGVPTSMMPRLDLPRRSTKSFTSCVARDPPRIKLSSLVSCMANWGETSPFIVEGRVHTARPGVPSLYLL